MSLNQNSPRSKNIYRDYRYRADSEAERKGSCLNISFTSSSLFNPSTYPSPFERHDEEHSGQKSVTKQDRQSSFPYLKINQTQQEREEELNRKIADNYRVICELFSEFQMPIKKSCLPMNPRRKSRPTSLILRIGEKRIFLGSGRNERFEKGVVKNVKGR